MTKTPLRVVAQRHVANGAPEGVACDVSHAGHSRRRPRLPDGWEAMMSGADFSRILVGWDGSPCAVESLLSAGHLSGDREVLALAVIPSFATVEDAQQRDEMVAEVKAPLVERFEQVAPTVATSKRVSLEFETGEDEAAALLDHALRHDYGLVVLGLHGNEGEFHRRIGHVASHMVKAGCCPVLLVPEPGASSHPPPRHGALREALRHPFARNAPTRG